VRRSLDAIDANQIATGQEQLNGSNRDTRLSDVAAFIRCLKHDFFLRHERVSVLIEEKARRESERDSKLWSTLKDDECCCCERCAECCERAQFDSEDRQIDRALQTYVCESRRFVFVFLWLIVSFVFKQTFATCVGTVSVV
jgi:hypothetical protein